MTIEVDYTIDRPAHTRADRIALLRRSIQVTADIRACTACPLSTSKWVTSPVPYSGRVPASYVVVGEAPGRKENREGHPFVGPAGQMLRGMLVEAGLHPGDAMFCNTVSCWPGDTPSEQEMRACRHHLDAQIELAGTPFVLLCGNIPLISYRPDLRVGSVAGTTFVRGGKVFMPVHHPAWVLRNRYERDWVVSHLNAFGMMVRGETTPSWLFGTTCAQTGCTSWVDHYDPEGVPWCAVHWGRRWVTPTERLRDAKKKVAKLKVRLRRARQETMG